MPNTVTSVMERHQALCRRTGEALLAEQSTLLHAAALHLARVLARRGTVFLCGIGSVPVARAACQLADFLADGYALCRPALPVICLDGQSFHLARRLESLGDEAHMLLLLHPGTAAENEVETLLQTARQTGMEAVPLPCFPSSMPDTSPFAVASMLFVLTDTLARLVEYHLFENTSELLPEEEQSRPRSSFHAHL